MSHCIIFHKVIKNLAPAPDSTGFFFFFKLCWIHSEMPNSCRSRHPHQPLAGTAVASCFSSSFSSVAFNGRRQQFASCFGHDLKRHLIGQTTPRLAAKVFKWSLARWMSEMSELSSLRFDCKSGFGPQKDKDFICVTELKKCFV